MARIGLVFECEVDASKAFCAHANQFRKRPKLSEMRKSDGEKNGATRAECWWDVLGMLKIPDLPGHSLPITASNSPAVND